ncbi:MAG: BACON domain-containing protein [Bacteroidales bacterium]|nr:BACON domain-containing protein [Bacteroidales bacterium]
MKIIRQLILALASLAIFSSCLNEEEKLVATAIMTDKASLEFGIDDELTLSLTVYADAPWTVDCASWITVEPASGTAGETVLTVSVEPNIREELPDRPREAVITFVGRDHYADAVVDVFQNGDKYRDLVDGTLAEAFAQAAETFVGVKDVQVVALTSDGFVVKDQADYSYVTATQTVEVGDKGSVYAYVSSFNGFPSLKNADKFTKTSNEAVDYSSAKDITAVLQQYAAEEIELVSIEGKLSSKKIELYYEEGEQPAVRDSVVIELLNTHSSLKMSELDGWLVNAKGYVFGKNGNTVYMVPVVLEGIKSLEKVYFADDFEWIKWATVDAVGNDDQSTSVTNIWKADWADQFFAEFNRIGYQYLWSTVGDKEFKLGPEQAPNPSVGKDGSMYACKNYLKFGQSSYNGALRLPALSSIEGKVNVQIDFDWCWQVTGANKPDIMTVSVETTDGKFEQTGLAMSEALESTQSQEDGESHLAWQHATVILTEASAQSVLTIRPTYADPSRQNPDRSQNRWYLDNIKIIEYTGSVSVTEPSEANISISMANNITFDAIPAAPASFTFLSDQEATLITGADWIYFVGADDAQLASITIPAGTSTEVLVGCKEYTGSEARTTEITIESGISVKTIPVKQVSPGQKIEPFISLVGGNYTEFPMEGGEYSMTVQANIDYEYESTCDWLTVEPVPTTRAMVETAAFVVKCQAGTEESRTGSVRVFNKDNNLETVLRVKQNGLDGPKTLALFPFTYDTTFDASKVEGPWNLAEGWILSEEGTSKLSSHLADGTALKVTYKYEAAAADGTKDHVRVLATGMPLGGYWLFEVPVKDMPAGTYNITYKQSASATGPNYFLVEVSVDGQNWMPAGAQTTTETFKDGTGGREVTWSYAINRGGVNIANYPYVVDIDYVAPALPGENTLYIRAKIADNMAYGATKAMGGSGTNRIWGPCEVTFTKQ